MKDLDSWLPGIQEGDPMVFAQWLVDAEQPVRRSLRRFAERVDTESVFQEAMLRVWNTAGEVVPTGRNSLLRYALRIARNLAIDEVRRAGREVHLDEMSLDYGPEDPSISFPDPHLRKRIRECYELLPKKPRAVLTMRLTDQGHAPDRTLAVRVGMKLNTFHQNFGRARRLMRECLERHGIRLP